MRHFWHVSHWTHSSCVGGGGGGGSISGTVVSRHEKHMPSTASPASIALPQRQHALGTPCECPCADGASEDGPAFRSRMESVYDRRDDPSSSSRLAERVEELFMAFAETASKRLHQFKTQELSNMAWAFCCVDRSDEPLFAALARQAEQCQGEFNT